MCDKNDELTPTIVVQIAKAKKFCTSSFVLDCVNSSVSSLLAWTLMAFSTSEEVEVVFAENTEKSSTKSKLHLTMN